MKSNDQCVLPHDKGWAVKQRTARRATEVHQAKLLAIDRAVGLAKRQECHVAVHDERGKQQARWDPLEDPDYFFVSLA